MGDDEDLARFRRDVLRMTGARDLTDLRFSPAVARLEPDLAAVARLRIGLDRDPARPRTRAEVAEALGLGGARIAEMVAALEDDVLDALGPGSVAGGA